MVRGGENERLAIALRKRQRGGNGLVVGENLVQVGGSVVGVPGVVDPAALDHEKKTVFVAA